MQDCHGFTLLLLTAATGNYCYGFLNFLVHIILVMSFLTMQRLSSTFLWRFGRFILWACRDVVGLTAPLVDCGSTRVTHGRWDA
jgi:hypothetical protein